MNEPTNILKFRGVSITADGASIGNLDLCLNTGDLALVLVDQERGRILWADAAEGLVAPARGTVTFLGEDWRTMTPDRVAQQRGRIGRVFEGECWRSDLDVEQNTTLAPNHPTRHGMKEIEEEAIELCSVFGLPGLPRGRQAGARWQDLLRAACVRAFLGAPDLILLENPTSGHYAECMVPLLKTVHAARQRGAAGLWMTNDLRVWNHSELHATLRCRMNGSQMQVMADGEGVA